MQESLVLYVCYNDDCWNFLESVDKYCKDKEIKVISYNESNYKERKKAYKIKGGYSARMTPFMLLMEDDKYKKAFYSEDDGCTLNKLQRYV